MFNPYLFWPFFSYVAYPLPKKVHRCSPLSFAKPLVPTTSSPCSHENDKPIHLLTHSSNLRPFHFPHRFHPNFHDSRAGKGSEEPRYRYHRKPVAKSSARHRSQKEAAQTHAGSTPPVFSTHTNWRGKDAGRFPKCWLKAAAPKPRIAKQLCNGGKSSKTSWRTEQKSEGNYRQK